VGFDSCDYIAYKKLYASSFDKPVESYLQTQREFTHILRCNLNVLIFTFLKFLIDVCMLAPCARARALAHYSYACWGWCHFAC
jgi:hypothetical protein